MASGDGRRICTFISVDINLEHRIQTPESEKLLKGVTKLGCIMSDFAAEILGVNGTFGDFCLFSCRCLCAFSSFFLHFKTHFHDGFSHWIRKRAEPGVEQESGREAWVSLVVAEGRLELGGVCNSVVPSVSAGQR